MIGGAKTPGNQRRASTTRGRVRAMADEGQSRAAIMAAMMDAGANPSTVTSYISDECDEDEDPWPLVARACDDHLHDLKREHGPAEASAPVHREDRLDATESAVEKPSDADLHILAEYRLRNVGPTLRTIINAVAEHFGLSPVEMLYRTRVKKIAIPRFVVVAIARERTALSFSAIAQRFGGYDHTTLVHGHARALKDFAADIAAVRAILDNREGRA